jgi:hypothetical protein
MKDHHFLYTLIPLLLLIVLPWLFGRLGSKAKKQSGQQTDESARPFPEPTGGQGYSEAEEDWLLMEEPGLESFEGIDTSFADRQKMTGFRDIPATTISPKPIKPRWWA